MKALEYHLPWSILKLGWMIVTEKETATWFFSNLLFAEDFKAESFFFYI